MAIVSYDIDPTNPELALLGDETGKQRAVPVTEAANFSSLPTRSTYMTAGDVQTPATSPAPLLPRAAAVMAKRDAVLPPTGAGMIKTGTQTTTNTVYGRDKAVVEKQISDEEKAAQEQDRTLTETATRADERADTAIRTKQQGVQQLAASDVQKGFEIKQQQQQVQAQKQQLEAELKANDESFDADRLINNMSTGRKIGMIILAGLQGAFNNLLDKRGPNEVIQVLQNQIDVDIQAQKEAIRAGQSRIGNQLQEIMRKGYDLEQAEKILYDRLQGGVAKMAELEADRLGLQGAQLDQAKQMITGLQQQRLARRNDLLASAENRKQTSSTETYQTQTKGQDSLEDIVKKMKAVRDVEQLTRSGLTQDEYDKQAEKVTEKGEKARDFRNSVEDLAAAVGVTIRRNKDGSVTVAGDPDSGFGLWGSESGALASDKRNQVTRAFSRVQRADVMGMIREPSAALQNKFAAATERPFLDGDILGQIKDLAEIAYRADNDFATGFNPVVVQDYRKATSSSLGVR